MKPVELTARFLCKIAGFQADNTTRRQCEDSGTLHLKATETFAWEAFQDEARELLNALNREGD